VPAAGRDNMRMCLPALCPTGPQEVYTSQPRKQDRAAAAGGSYSKMTQQHSLAS